VPHEFDIMTVRLPIPINKGETARRHPLIGTAVSRALD
jgi:hypothetical protein